MKTRLEEIDRQCNNTIELLSELVEGLLLELKISRRDCEKSLAESVEFTGTTRSEEDIDLLKLHLGTLLLGISSARDALANKQTELFIRLFTTVSIDYGMTFMLLNKKNALSKKMRKKAFLRITNNLDANKKQTIKEQFFDECGVNQKRFLERGFLANFLRSFAKKYPIIEDPKTFENWYYAFKKKDSCPT